jgi:hypothetical protein
MSQESVTIDLRTMIREPSTSLKIHTLVLLVACIVAGVRLFNMWRTAPPFKLSRQASNPEYLKLLQASSNSLKQWIGCTFLAWGILASTALADGCYRWLGPETTGRMWVADAVEDFATALSATLLVALFLFLVRWHMLTRIERLSR